MSWYKHLTSKMNSNEYKQDKDFWAVHFRIKVYFYRPLSSAILIHVHGPCDIAKRHTLMCQTTRCQTHVYTHGYGDLITCNVLNMHAEWKLTHFRGILTSHMKKEVWSTFNNIDRVLSNNSTGHFNLNRWDSMYSS